jgi:hypothetical protein
LKLNHLAIAAGISFLAISAGTPAKAISYYLTGSDQYTCNTGETCTVTYNNFGLDYTGTNWSQLTTGDIGNIVFQNGSNSFTFFQDLTSINNTGSGARVGFTSGSDNIFLNLSPAVNGTPFNSANTASLFSTNFSNTALDIDTSPATLTGTGLIKAVPFASSVLALLPLGIFSRKSRLRNLSA